MYLAVDILEQIQPPSPSVRHHFHTAELSSETPSTQVVASSEESLSTDSNKELNLIKMLPSLIS